MPSWRRQQPSSELISERFESFRRSAVVDTAASRQLKVGPPLPHLAPRTPAWSHRTSSHPLLACSHRTSSHPLLACSHRTSSHRTSSHFAGGSTPPPWLRRTAGREVAETQPRGGRGSLQRVARGALAVKSSTHPMPIPAPAEPPPLRLRCEETSLHTSSCEQASPLPSATAFAPRLASSRHRPVSPNGTLLPVPPPRRPPAACRLFEALIGGGGAGAALQRGEGAGGWCGGRAGGHGCVPRLQNGLPSVARRAWGRVWSCEQGGPAVNRLDVGGVEGVGDAAAALRPPHQRSRRRRRPADAAVNGASSQPRGVSRRPPMPSTCPSTPPQHSPRPPTSSSSSPPQLSPPSLYAPPPPSVRTQP